MTRPATLSATQRALAAALAALLLIVASGAALPGAAPPTVGGAPGAPVSAQAAAQDELPLVPDRRVRFTTDEGTWISLDVSPDGQTIVFDLLGDLYRLPIGGGKATLLTRGMGFDAQPRYSPDGTHVVFTSDRSGSENLWTVAVGDGTVRRVTRETAGLFASPAWTPDGQFIVASRTPLLNGAFRLVMYHVGGGSGVPLLRPSDSLQALGAASGADHRYLWYAERQGIGGGVDFLPTYQLHVFDRVTGQSSRRSDRYGSAFRPTLSLDGRWLVYGTREDDRSALRVRDLRTGNERWLVTGLDRDEQEGRGTRDVLPGFTFTPDSTAIVAAYQGRIWRVPIDGSAPRQIPFEADVDLELGPRLDFESRIAETPAFSVHQIRDAAPSGDGRHLAFAALGQLWVMDYPDGSPRRLTRLTVAEHQPAWSPDGRWLAFVSWSSDGGHLYRVAVAGGEPERLTPVAGLYQQPAWSLDGERIVYLRAAAQAFHDITTFQMPAIGVDLVWVPATGGTPTVVAPLEDGGYPHFVPTDRDRIYLSADGRLLSMRWDGTDLRRHLRVVGAPLPASREPLAATVVRLSPTGRHVLARVGNDVFLLPSPGAGPEVEVSVATPAQAAVPVWSLAPMGGEFPGWSADGRQAHWSLGPAYVVADITGLAAAGDTAPPRETRIHLEAPRDLPDTTLLLRGARIITMRGDEVIARGDVLIERRRITAVGRTGTLRVPATARVLDVSGRTIAPGFVDVHGHVWPSRGILKTDAWMYRANLAYGVTTSHDPQTAATDVLTYQDLETAGRLLAPRIFHTGPGLGDRERWRDYAHVTTVLRKYADYYGVTTIKQYLSGNRRVRQWIAMAARELKLRPTTEGAIDLELDLTHIIDGYPGHEHSFPTAPIYRDVRTLLAQSGTTYTPTLLVAYGGPQGEFRYFSTEDPHADEKLRRFVPHEEIDRRALRRRGWFHPLTDVFPAHARFLPALLRDGGRIAVGSHGQLQGLGYHWELWAMESGGLSRHEVLRAGTRAGAEAIGLGRDLGSIEPGKLADLLVFDRNPLEDIRHTNTVRWVVKNGRVYDASTLDLLPPDARPSR